MYLMLIVRAGGCSIRSLRQGKTVHPLTQTTLVSSIAFFLCVVPSLFENPLTALSAIGWHAWLALVGTVLL
ncbi:hypothetical protein ACFSL6_27585 [Paenibacillus thailandensis]|uniref:hypothetical protein n=1 Tax=Paenibacillus thailandensis TaxID=393250 RepID=UPI00362F4E97